MLHIFNRLGGCRIEIQWMILKKLNKEIIAQPKISELALLSSSFNLSFKRRNVFTGMAFRSDSNYSEEVKKILSVPKNKLKQLGFVNASEIYKVIKELYLYKQNLTTDDIDVLFTMVGHTIERENVYHPVIDRFCQLVLFFNCISSEQIVLYLKISLQANKKVSIEDFLKILDNNKVSLTQESAELMMNNLARFGDIIGTNLLLSLMSQNNLTVNENIFYSLILVNGIHRGDKEISEILIAVQSAKGKFSLDIECSLLIAQFYGKKRIDINFIIDKWKDSYQKLSPEKICDIIIHFVKSGNCKENCALLDHILNSVTAAAEGNIDVRKQVIWLIRDNYPKEAVHILCQLQNLKRNSRSYGNNSFVIRELVKTNCDPGLIIELCDELKDKGINMFTFQIALETALQERNVELSRTLLKALKSRNESIREHYFWPLFATESPDGDQVANTLNELSGMLELGTSPGFETLHSYVIPKLPIENLNDTLQMLSKCGISEASAVTPYMTVLLSKHLISQAKELAKLSTASIVTEKVMKYLSQSYVINPKDTIDILNILLSTTINKNNVNVDYGGWLLEEILANHEIGSDILKVKEVCKFLVEAKIGISQSCLDDVMTFMEPSFQLEVQKSLEPLVNESLESRNAPNKTSFIPHPKEMNLSELEAHLSELTSKKMNTRGILRKLFILHSLSKNTERCKEITQIITEKETKLSPGMQSSLMQTKINEKDIEGALECYYLLSFEDPSFLIDSFKVLDLCHLLVAEGKTEDALQILLDFINRAPNSYHNKRSILRNCHNLLSLISEKDGYSMTKEFFSLLLSGGLAEPSTILLGSLIKAKLVNNDLEGAVAEAEEIYSTHRILPYRVEILIQLIKRLNAIKEEKSDEKWNGPADLPALIDKMIGLCSTARGHKQAREDLLAASIETGIFDECLRVFKFVEKDLRTENIRNLCNNYVRREKTQSLLMLLKISKSSRKVDRMYICQCLLNIYNVNRNGAEALNLWNSMQDENFPLTDSFINKLSSILKATNVESPFSKNVGL